MKPTSQPHLPLRHRTVDVIASHEGTGHAAAYEVKAAPTPTHGVLTQSGCKAKGQASHHAVKKGIWTGGSHEESWSLTASRQAGSSASRALFVMS